MSVKDSNIQTQIEERLDGWRINESVWDWIVRKTGIKPTIGGIEELAGQANISRTALRKLKKTQQHSLSRQDLRDSLAKYTFEIPGVKEPVKLGYYGYPPGYIYVEPRPALQQVYKEFSSQPLNEARQVGYQEPEVRLTTKQKEINKRIKSDFDHIPELIKFSSLDDLPLAMHCIGLCEYCKPHQNSWSATNKQHQYIEDMPGRDFFPMYLSTHKHKLYGAAAIRPGKGFELEIEICEHCLSEISEIFLIPISYLIKKIMLRYNLSQPNLASEIGVRQVTISRLLNDKTDFINPDLLKKLYDFWRFGPETIYKNEYQRLLPSILDNGLINSQKNSVFEFDEMEIEYNPWLPPWEEDLEFLIDRGAISNPSVLTNLIKFEPFSSVVIDSEFLRMFVDSNEIYFEFKVKYTVNLCDNGVVFEKAKGTLSIKHVLVDIKNRLLSEYFFFEIERLTVVTPDKHDKPDKPWWLDDVIMDVYNSIKE